MKKTNRTFKRFAAITSASLLAACAVMPAISFAEARPIDKGSITIKTEETDHNYSAYQVFDGNLSEDTETGAITFSNVVWGSGMNIDAEKNMNLVNGGNIYQDLYDLNITKKVAVPDTEPEEFVDVNVFSKKDATSGRDVILTSAEEVSNALTSISGNIPGMTTYADIDKVATVFAKYKGATATKTISEITADYDGDTDGKQSGYVFSDLKAGYYFVEEIAADIPEGEENPSLAEGEAKTKYLLQVAGNALVSPKADAPKVMKKVLEDSKTTADKVVFNSATADYQLVKGYNDVADYSIGETIHFTLYGSLPTSFDNYKGYYYQFTDTMSQGFDFVDLNKPDGLDSGDFTVEVTDYNSDGTAKTPVKLTTDQFELGINGKVLTVTIPDLKLIDMDTSTTGVTDVMSSKAIITVKYAAKLNSGATIGNDGNSNEVYLTYSNNSNTAQGGLNDTGDGPKDETGNTATDYNVVFTYQLDVTKKLGETGLATNETGKKAGFRLYNADKSKVATFEGNKFTGWEDSVVVNKFETKGTEIFTTANGTFSFIGIQDGTYYLTETTIPTGYNRMEDKKVVITADTNNAAADTCQNYMETDATQKGMVLDRLTIKVDSEEEKPGSLTDGKVDGKVAMSVTNNKGNELPGTGGIGTTIFYLGGGAMAAIGGVYLISKRRMKKSEE